MEELAVEVAVSSSVYSHDIQYNAHNPNRWCGWPLEWHSISADASMCKPILTTHTLQKRLFSMPFVRYGHPWHIADTDFVQESYSCSSMCSPGSM